MKVTVDNIKDITYFAGIKDKIENNQSLLQALLIDLEEFNTILENNSKGDKKLFIDYIDTHTEYSPERTDPCPDYYGLFRLRLENNTKDIIGIELSLNELDTTLCEFVNFAEELYKV
jgi:hypothetical protein